MITTTDYEKRAIEAHIRASGSMHVLEIGAFRGETTRVIADAVAEVGGRVVVIDPMRWSSEILRNGIARHLSTSFPRVLAALERMLDLASYEPAFWRNVGGRGRKNVILYQALSSDASVLESDDPELAAFDLVFIDGDHGYDGAKRDLELWGGRVRDGGLVLVHDATDRFPGVMRALREWGDDPRVEVVWPTRDSLCVARVRHSAQASARTPRSAQSDVGDGRMAQVSMSHLGQ